MKLLVGRENGPASSWNPNAFGGQGSTIKLGSNTVYLVVIANHTEAR